MVYRCDLILSRLGTISRSHNKYGVENSELSRFNSQPYSTLYKKHTKYFSC